MLETLAPRQYASILHQNADMRPAKRLKKFESEGHSLLGDCDTVSVTETLRPYRLEIPGSEEQEFVNEPTMEDQRLTELENSVASVRTDREAIARYESMRATDGEITVDTREHCDLGNWMKGRTSIYVDAFNLALDTVLQDESHLFDEAETAVLTQWRSLDYEAQYL